MRRLSLPLALALVTGASAQDDMSYYTALKPYFVRDTNMVAQPHNTYELHVGAVVDSVRYNGTWHADKNRLCTRLIKQAASQERSALFKLRFVEDNVNLGMIGGLGHTIVDAWRNAGIDTVATRCVIHTEEVIMPAMGLAPRTEVLADTVHIAADGSFLLDGLRVDRNSLGAMVQERRINEVRITADPTAQVGALVDLLQIMSNLRIKAVLATKPR